MSGWGTSFDQEGWRWKESRGVVKLVYINTELVILRTLDTELEREMVRTSGPVLVLFYQQGGELGEVQHIFGFFTPVFSRTTSP